MPYLLTYFVFAEKLIFAIVFKIDPPLRPARAAMAATICELAVSRFTVDKQGLATPPLDSAPWLNVIKNGATLLQC